MLLLISWFFISNIRYSINLNFILFIIIRFIYVRVYFYGVILGFRLIDLKYSYSRK